MDTTTTPSTRRRQLKALATSDLLAAADAAVADSGRFAAILEQQVASLHLKSSAAARKELALTVAAIEQSSGRTYA